jgi:iron complex transport system ATP-binding protein
LGERGLCKPEVEGSSPFVSTMYSSQAGGHAPAGLYHWPMSSDAPTHTSPPLAEFRDATVVLGGKTVLDAVTLTLRSDEHVAILGPNGSGKSTLVRTIAGDARPLAREDAAVRVFGQERWSLWELRARLGVVSEALQSDYGRRVTVRDAVVSGFFGSIGTYPHQHITAAMRGKAAELIDFLEISRLAERHMDSLSTGEARRALIARALVHDPEALVLDEPYSGLDPHARFAVRSAVRSLAQSGVAIVLVTHDISDIVPEIDRVVMLCDGRIAGDLPKAEALTAASLSALFSIDANVTEAGGYYHLW